jgi:hypothetical protein
MNQDFQIPKKTFLLIPAGTYRATITGLEKAAGVYGEQVKITFHVLTDDVEYTDGSVDLLAWCSTNYSEKSKLFRWARAALAGDFDPSADFQAAKLINKRVMINVEKNISANGGEINKIVDIMAVPRGKANSTAVSPDPDPEIQTNIVAQTKLATPPEPPAPPDDIIPW